jgi:hypothetical protein
MPVHDWTRVVPDIWHHFHVAWIVRLSDALAAILPEGYYAMAEQHLSRKAGDVLTLHRSVADLTQPAPEPPEGGTLTVLETPPKASVRLVAADIGKGKRRTLTIRHSSDDRIIALVEILSPSNKKTAADVAEFVEKACGAIRAGIHVVLVDLFAPSKRMRGGMHAAIWKELGQDEWFAPPGKPLTVAGYAAGESVVAYVEPLAVGDEVPDMPLFLTSEHYVNLPLRSTYEETYRRSFPQRWHAVLEERADG